MRQSEYRERAVAYFRLAKDTVNPGHRTKLLEMALAWMRLADQAEKRQADLGYETPPGAVSQPIQQQQQQDEVAPPDQRGEARLRGLGR
jgi:hypothetical protein